MGAYGAQNEDQDDSISNNIVSAAADVPLFDKGRHVKYWLRCLRTPLSQPYTSNDANRMTLTFFILSALDVLGVLFTRTTPSERQEYKDWIYSHQHHDGGFRGSSSTDFGSSGNEANAKWDPATLSATYFALGSLSVLADDLTRVERRKCLSWLRKMQRTDGSFGDFLGPDGVIEGGLDTRFGYFAASIRWWLRGTGPSNCDEVPDFDVEGLIDCIGHSETYDGGISEEPFREAHAGFTYCAIATLACLDRSKSAANMSRMSNGAAKGDKSALASGLSSHDHTIRWLIERLTREIDSDDFDGPDDVSEISETFTQGAPNINGATLDVEGQKKDGFSKLRSTPIGLSSNLSKESDASPAPFLDTDVLQTRWTGFNGRANKVADTCYAFWVGASLQILDAKDSVNLTYIRCYLLEKTQHMIAGGFGKMPGDLPDVYHAYLGLAALALIDGRDDDGYSVGPTMEDTQRIVEGQKDKSEADTRRGDCDRYVRALDPVLCISMGAKRWVEGLEWRKGQRDT